LFYTSFVNKGWERSRGQRINFYENSATTSEECPKHADHRRYWQAPPWQEVGGLASKIHEFLTFQIFLYRMTVMMVEWSFGVACFDSSGRSLKKMRYGTAVQPMACDRTLAGGKPREGGAVSPVGHKRTHSGKSTMCLWWRWAAKGSQSCLTSHKKCLLYMRDGSIPPNTWSKKASTCSRAISLL